MTTEIVVTVRGSVWIRWDMGKSYDYRDRGPVSGWMWDTGMSYDNRDRRSVRGSVWVQLDTGKSYDCKDKGYRERFGVDSVGHGEVI